MGGAWEVGRRLKLTLLCFIQLTTKQEIFSFWTIYEINVSKFNGCSQGCWEDCGGPGHANTKVGPIQEIVQGGLGACFHGILRLYSVFWGLLRLFFVHAYTTCMFRTVAQPSSHCATGHPAVQRYVTGLNFCHAANLLPVQKSCYARLFGHCEDAKKGTHQFYLPLWWKAR